MVALEPEDDSSVSFTMATGKVPKARKEREKGKSPPPPAANGHPDPDAFAVDNLEKMCTIGTGTFGRVFLVRHKSNKEFYALKVLSIRDVVKSKQVDHVHSEKRILEVVQHPFIVSMHWSHRDEKCLYMLFDYVPGGELFSYLRNAGHFSNSTGRFFAAEIVLALDYLHQKNIVYRDLKPENVLIHKDGHLKITDFGFAKELDDRTWTLCGTPEYLAPEIVENRGHNKGVDWWALGILIFEMLAGYPPFRGENPIDIYEKIIEGVPKFPPHFDLVAKDLVRKFLVADRTKRLGNMKGGSKDVKNHKWFREIDWNDVYERKLEPPIIPKILYDGDSGNFEEYDEEELSQIVSASSRDQELFVKW